MKKRINFTGRKSLSVENVRIRVHPAKVEGHAPSFTADLDLPGNWQLNKDAKVYVEAYVKSSSMRFAFGTVSQISPPNDTELIELDRAEGMLFRVKVVDESAEVGKILASANRIQPLGEEGVKSLLTLRLTDLGEGVWRLAIGGGAPPVLELNNNIPGIQDRLRQDPLLQGAIYPEALRQIVDDLLSNDENDDEMKWVQDWRTFAERLVGEKLPDDLSDDDQESERGRIVDTVVNKFCAWQRFATAATKNEEKIVNG
jgi:hypothetical protein